VVLEEFGYTGLQNQTTIYPQWIMAALASGHAGIMPWQWGQLGLTEAGGNRVLKYADVLLDGASPNDGFAIYENETDVYNLFMYVQLAMLVVTSLTSATLVLRLIFKLPSRIDVETTVRIQYNSW
jgi:hypothetical protein